MKKLKVSIILNSIIFILFVIGLIMMITGLKFDLTYEKYSFAFHIKYFTVESNIFMGIMSLLFIINEVLHIKKGIEINKILFIFKYMATICVAITFFTVALFLAPVFYQERYFELFYDVNLFFHFLIPVLSIIVFIFFENRNDLSIKETFLGLIPFVVYTIFYLIAALTHMSDGKVAKGYDWYGFLYFGIPVFFPLAIGMIGLVYLISFIIYFLNKKFYKLKQE